MAVPLEKSEKPWLWKKGKPPGPGRPPGMRNKLTEIALKALGEDFEKHGAEAITKVRIEKTHVYLQIVASLLPRQLHVERSSPLGDLSDEELEQLEQHLKAVRAKTVKQIEQQLQQQPIAKSDAEPDQSVGEFVGRIEQTNKT